MADYMVDHGVTEATTGRSFLDAVREAQDNVLEPYRQRPVKNAMAFKFLADEIRNVIRVRKSNEAIPPAKDEEPEPEQEPEETEPEQEIAAEQPAQNRAMRLADAIGTLFDVMAEDLVDLFVDRLDTALERVSAERLARYVGATRAKRDGKPKIMVAGLKEANAGMIKTEFRDVLDLRFVDPDYNKKGLRDKARNVDVVIVMKDFVPHDMVSLLSINPNLHKLSGGLDTLRSVLVGYTLEHHRE